MTIIHTHSARGKLKAPLFPPSDAAGSSRCQWIFQGKFADLTECEASERKKTVPLSKILTRDHFSPFPAEIVIKDNFFWDFLVYRVEKYNHE
jgi:hypothetical protein